MTFLLETDSCAISLVTVETPFQIKNWARGLGCNPSQLKMRVAGTAVRAGRQENGSPTREGMKWLSPRYPRASQPGYSWRFQSGQFMWWWLFCSLKDVERNPWPLPTGCQQHPQVRATQNVFRLCQCALGAGVGGQKIAPGWESLIESPHTTVEISGWGWGACSLRRRHRYLLLGRNSCG